MRFARADGSKGSNKKTEEAATPWLEMKSSFRNKSSTSRTNVENISNQLTDDAYLETKSEKNQLKNCNKFDTSNINVSTILEDTRSPEKKIEKSSNITKSRKRKITDDIEGTSNFSTTKSKKNLLEDDAEIKLANKENQAEKSARTKLQKSNKDRPATAKVSGNLNFKKISRPLPTSSMKYQNKANVEKKKKDFIEENGKRYKLFKKSGVKKPWFDLPFEENEIMTRYNTMYIKRDMVEVLNDLKQSFIDQGLDSRQVANKILTKERKAHNKLRVELLRQQIRKVEELTGDKTEKIFPERGLQNEAKIALTKNKDNNKKNYVKGAKNSEKKETLIKSSKNDSINKNLDSEKISVDGAIRDQETTEENNVEKKKSKEKRKNQKTQHVQSDEKTKCNDDGTIKTEKSNEKKASKSNKKDKSKKILDDSNFVIKNGQKYKVLKSGSHRKWIELPFEENDFMTMYKNFFVKKEDATSLIKMKESMEKEGLKESEIEKKMIIEEKKANKRLRKALLSDKMKSRKTKRETTESEKIKDHIPFKPVYEETEMMAKFEDYFVLRRNLNKLTCIYDWKVKRIIGKRENRDESEKLSDGETLELRRLMKKEKRREQRLLDRELLMIKKNEGNPDGSRRSMNNRRSKPGLYKGIKYGEEDKNMVKFQGYWVKKEAGDRLNKLSNKLETEGANSDEISMALKGERRIEERILKRENQLYCFNCRKVGHLLALCPDETASSNVCFSCGSTEHYSRDCTARKSSGPQYGHATCFVCGKIGHISRECPDNPRGIYPHGGCCNECGSVEHLKMNCPDLQKRKEKDEIFAGSMNAYGGIEAMEFVPGDVNSNMKSSNSKRIVFNDSD